MKKILKNIGSIFIVLSQKQEKDMRQTVLLVDGSFILPNNFALIIKNVKERFKNASITVLTFKDKENFIKDNFRDVEVITPGGSITKRHQLAVKLFLLLRRKYAFIVVSSLDISLILVTMFFSRQPVFLYNRWFEWYRIRCRTVLDTLLGVKSEDKNRRRINRGFMDKLKSLGRFFIVLSQFDEDDIKQPLLIVDDGHGEIGYISTAVRKAKANFINPDISVITFPNRKHYFMEMVPQGNIVTVKYPDRRFSLAMQMYRMRKSVFSRIILTSLDIMPILVSFSFMHSEVFLYNKWHEWWNLAFRSPYGYIKGIFSLVYNFFIFIYLLIVSGYILLKIGMRSLWMNLTSPRENI